MNHLQDTEPPYKMERSLYFNMALMLVGAAGLLGFNGPYLRLEHEKRQEQYDEVPTKINSESQPALEFLQSGQLAWK